MRIIFFITALVLSVSIGFTQVEQPQVGKKMPPFLLKVKGSTKKQISLDDFKGKWLFIDFWSLNCKACIESFPKINSLQQTYRDELQIVLVGDNNHYNKGIERTYEKINQRLKMDVLAVFDSVLRNKWSVITLPHIFVIDPEGIVRYITDNRDLTYEKVGNLIDGKRVSFFPKIPNEARPIFDPSATLANDAMQYASCLTRWQGERQNSGFDIDKFVKFPEEYKTQGWSVGAAPLSELFNYAYLGRAFWLPYDTEYYGKVWPFPQLEVSDSSVFDYDNGRGAYNYYLKMPLNRLNMENMMAQIQSSLQNAFGFNASIEMRDMPVWKLVVTDRKKVDQLTTKGGKPYTNLGNSPLGFTVKNYSMRDFLSAITSSLPNKDRMAYIDETGITFKLDVTIDADLTYIEGVQMTLRKFGLQLLKGTNKMKVLVIRDSNPN